MIRSLAILAIATLVFCGAEAQQTNDSISLRATVKEVVMLSSFSGTVLPVDIDSRFALTLHIESVAPVVTNFAVDSVVSFAIHSPSRLFAGENAKDKTFDFSVRHKTEKGKTRYFELAIQV